MHALVFANQHGENKGAFARDRLARMAEMLGLDTAAFVTLLDDPALRAAVKAELAEGSAAGVSQTPTLSINGTLTSGAPSWDELKQLVEAARGG